MKKCNDLLPEWVIDSAVNGDVNAIHKVVDHYSSYIATLSSRPISSSLGIRSGYIIEELRRNLETKLINKLSTFRI